MTADRRGASGQDASKAFRLDQAVSVMEGSPHQDQPVLAQEHMAILDLVPVAEASHQAVRSGPWSDPDTWKDGRLPDDGARVHLPAGVVVTLTERWSPSLRWVRLDGTLRFDPLSTTELKVDTLVSAPKGRLEVGTSAQPIDANHSARIVFADLGPLSVDRDPSLLGRGAVLHGETLVHGAPKRSAIAVARPPRQGDRDLLLEAAPLNWRVGDRLVLAGTSHGADGDELVRIADLDGTRVSLDRPLDMDHLSPRDHLRPHLANLTRNVEFSSESTQLDRRGHVMLMHARDVDIANAAFRDLGRTDKLKVVDPPYFEKDGTFVEGTGTNQSGRYSLHFHRNGVDRSTVPARVTGSVVEGSPGWGFVNHSSYVDFVDNVAYDVSGSAFSTEVGDEIGSFKKNYAIRMHGTGEEPILRQELGDFGHAGDGFWLQGSGVEVVDNVVSGATGSGLILYAEPLFEDGLGLPVFPAASLFDPSGVNGEQTIPVSLVPLAPFRGNEAYGSALGAQIYYHRTFITIEEEEEAQAGAFAFPLSVMEDMDLWSNENGMLINYTVDTLFRDIRIVGPTDASGEIGFDAGANLYNRGVHQYQNISVEDYEVGFSLPRSGEIVVDGGYFSNNVDLHIPEPRQIGRRLRFQGDLTFGDQPLGLDPEDREERLHFQMDPEFAPAADSANEHFLLDDQVLLDVAPYNGQQLYFQEQVADFVLFPEMPDQLDPEDPGPTIGDEFIGETNAEMQARLGRSFGGVIPPDDAAELPRVQGLVGDPAIGFALLNPNPLPDESADDEIGDGVEIVLARSDRSHRLHWKGDRLIERASERIRHDLTDVEVLEVVASQPPADIRWTLKPRGNDALQELALLTDQGDDTIVLRAARRSSIAPPMLVASGAGNDRIEVQPMEAFVEIDAGAGADRLHVSALESELRGGRGRDVFVFERATGLHRLTDFDPSQDRLDLSDAIAALPWELERQRGNLLLVVDDEPLLQLDGLASLANGFDDVLI